MKTINSELVMSAKNAAIQDNIASTIVDLMPKYLRSIVVEAIASTDTELGQFVVRKWRKVNKTERGTFKQTPFYIILTMNDDGYQWSLVG